VSIWLWNVEADYRADDIRARVAAPTVTAAIVRKLTDRYLILRKVALRTLVELAKYSKCVHLAMTCTS
jgi:hypothetical protein